MASAGAMSWPFMEAILQFWVSGEKTLVAPFLPSEVYAEVPESGPLVDDMRRIFQALLSAVNRLEDLLDLSEADVQKLVSRVEDVREEVLRLVDAAEHSGLRGPGFPCLVPHGATLILRRPLSQDRRRG